MSLPKITSAWCGKSFLRDCYQKTWMCKLQRNSLGQPMKPNHAEEPSFKCRGENWELCDLHQHDLARINVGGHCHWWDHERHISVSTVCSPSVSWQQIVLVGNWLWSWWLMRLWTPDRSKDEVVMYGSPGQKMLRVTDDRRCYSHYRCCCCRCYHCHSRPVVEHQQWAMAVNPLHRRSRLASPSSIASTTDLISAGENYSSTAGNPSGNASSSWQCKNVLAEC